MSYASHADLGGRPCAEAVLPEPEGELFHAGWEPQVLAMTLAMGATGSWNIDQSRAARETLPAYARLSYYEIWFEALLALMAERGLVSAAEAEAGRLIDAAKPVARVFAAAEVAAVLSRGSPTERQPDPQTQPPRFAAGDRVRTISKASDHHTRLPAYARGKNGRVEALRGLHVFADSQAQGQGEQPQWLYTVVFAGRDLWPDADPGLSVSIDAWQTYLEPDA